MNPFEPFCGLPSRGPTKVYDTVCPFAHAIIKPQGEAKMIAAPQITFRPIQLYFPHSIAHLISIKDVQLGRNVLNVGMGLIPGSSFCERRNPQKTRNLFAFPTMNPGEVCQILVFNKSEEELFVEAYLCGVALAP